MKVINHGIQQREEWRAGVLTRMRVSMLTGNKQLCIFDQWCQPGLGAPTHFHAVEEVLDVIEGQAEIWVGDDNATVIQDHSVIIPAGYRHGFRNCGETVLMVRATLAAPIFEAAYDDKSELSFRWVSESAS